MESAIGSARAPRRATSVLTVVGLVALPLVMYLVLLKAFWDRGELGIDFTQTLLPAAELVARGESPYPAYGYPPLVAFALVPFTIVPSPEILYTATMILGLVASLRVLGIRDWRCYGAAFLWGPSFHAVQTGNVTIPLLLGLAFAWRTRDRLQWTAIASGLAIATKIICWPALVWLAATRRVGAALSAFGVAFGTTAVLWGLVGFSGLRGYPSSLDRLESAQAPSSYTLTALLTDAGAPSLVARGAWAAMVAAVLLGVTVAGRKGDDRLSFSLAVFAAVVASPIVWLHSFVLLLAPLAIYRPRFGPLWLLPAALWFGSGTGNGAPWQTALVLGVGAATFVWTVLPRRARLAPQIRLANVIRVNGHPLDSDRPHRRGQGPSPE